MPGLTKQMYLIQGNVDESYRSFKERIHWEANFLLKEKQISWISYTITEDEPPGFSVIPFSTKKIACITIKKNDELPEKNFIKMLGFSGAFATTEALPVAYKKDWEDGERTPGVCLLTLLKKRKKIDYDTFIDRWHNGHTPLSLKIHPLWHYNRNVVEKQLAKSKKTWNGIVEEHTRTRSELLNPFKFFGNPLIVIPRMIEVFFDTRSFLEYRTIETYLVQEYILKS